MGDDGATVEQLRAELRQAREEIERRDRALAEAMEQQTATAEVLRVIASSPTNLFHVLDTIAEAAARLCDAPSAVVQRVDEASGVLGAVAGAGLIRPEIEQRRAEHGLSAVSPRAREPSPGFVGGRAFLDRQTIRVDDMAEAVKVEFPEARERQQILGIR